MEALAAFGVAANVVQFLDFATKLCVTSVEIYRGVHGASASNAQAEVLLKSFIATIDEVSSDLGQYSVALSTSSKEASRRGEAQIGAIVLDCQSVAEDLLQRYQKLKSGGSPGKWRSFVSGVKCMWKHQELEALQRRLKQNRDELEWRVLLSLRESLNLLASRQEDQFRELQSAMIAKLTEAIDRQMSTLPRWPQSTEITQQELRNDSIAMTASRYKQPEKSALRKADIPAGHHADPDGDSFADEYAMVYAAKLAELEEQQWRSLWFPVMDDREDQIALAELRTFDWILQAPQGKRHTWDSFIDWLERGGAIYWINGKAGSGKSTLMKYLKHHSMVQKTLASWAGSTSLITASFFFWYNGNTLQKTQEGLLRSLLYQALENHRELIPLVLSEVVDVPVRDLAHHWTLPRLKCAFRKLLQQKEVPVKLCLLIDGLDEYSGKHAEIAAVFRHAANLNHVKVCVSSRPLLVFDKSFKGFPGLMLQNLTFDDIQTFVKKKFNDDPRFKELEVEEPGLAPSLALQVVNKASGVFLWVKLVVHSLLEGIQNYDRGIDLERRLHELPDDLTELYWHILDRVRPVWYLEEGFKMLLLVHTAVMPLTLLQLAFADIEAPTCQDGRGNMSVERQNVMCKSMAGRIKSRCLGLVEVTDLTCRDEKYRRVQFLHKSVKDFIDTPKMMTRIQHCLSDKEPFVPEIAIIRALSVELMTLRTRLRKNQFCEEGGLTREAWYDEVRPVALEAVCYAAVAQSRNPKARKTYRPLILQIHNMTAELWESVNFRGARETASLVHWSDIPRKPLDNDPTVGDVNLEPPSRQVQSNNQAYSAEAIETLLLDNATAFSVSPEDNLMAPLPPQPEGPTPARVPLVRFFRPHSFPGDDDDDERPRKDWPPRDVWSSLFKLAKINATIASEFEGFIRNLGREDHGSDGFLRADDSKGAYQIFDSSIVQDTDPLTSERRLQKAMQSVRSILTPLLSRRSRRSEKQNRLC
ncbi:hypothetical protein ABEF95_008482 [Exophiala dermatitidis]